MPQCRRKCRQTGSTGREQEEDEEWVRIAMGQAQERLCADAGARRAVPGRRRGHREGACGTACLTPGDRCCQGVEG